MFGDTASTFMSADSVPATGTSALKPLGTATTAKVAGYLALPELSAYCSLSVRTLRDCLSDPTRPLPHYRLGDRGKVLVKVSEFDEWLSAYRRTTPEVNVCAIVNEMLGPRRVRVK